MFAKICVKFEKYFNRKSKEWKCFIEIVHIILQFRSTYENITFYTEEYLKNITRQLDRR